MNKDNYRIVTRLYAAMLVAAGVGAALGSVYYVNKYSGSPELKAYLDTVVTGLISGADAKRIFFDELWEKLFLAGIIALSALVKPGAAVSVLAALRQGFIYGFTDSAFIGAYGTRGVLAALARSPAFVPVIISLAAWGALNSAVGLGKLERAAGFKIFYIIFFAAVLSIFCAACAADVYLCTTFMKIIPITVT